MEIKRLKKIAVVVPVYYNEGSLALLHAKLAECAAQRPAYDFEFIFVDDGSGDRSLAVLEEISRGDERVRLVKLVRNFGSTAAVLAGLSHISPDTAAVGVIAADLQDPPELIVQMLDRWQAGSRMVLAARSERDDPFATRVFAAVFNWLFRRLAIKNWPAGGFDCFLIDRKVVKVLVQCAEKNTHLPGLLMWTGFDHEVIYYQRQRREHGKSRWNFGRKFKYFVDAFTAFSYFPLRICSLLGLITALVGLAYAAYVLVLGLFNLITVEGWTSLIIAVLVTAGIQLIMLGVVGEYLWRNFDQTRQRPIYIVDEIIERPANPTQELQTVPTEAHEIAGNRQ